MEILGSLSSVSLLDVFASAQASLAVGVTVTILLIRKGYHRGLQGDILKARLSKVFLGSIVVYIFGVCALGQLVLEGPSVSDLIHKFGEERIAWVMVGLVFDYTLTVWDHFRPYDEPAKNIGIIDINSLNQVSKI